MRRLQYGHLNKNQDDVKMNRGVDEEGATDTM